MTTQSQGEMSDAAGMTLSEFLLARITEEETIARENRGPEAAHTAACRYDQIAFLNGCKCEIPSRVLAECEAKRRIVAIAFEHMETIDAQWGCGHSADQIWAGHCPDSPDDDGILQALALPHVDHPDYRAEWRR